VSRWPIAGLVGREKVAILHPLFYLQAAVVVQAGELAEQTNRHIVIRNRGVLLIIKTADVNRVIFILYFRHPFSYLFMPVNALVSASAGRVRQAVVAVLCQRADSEIAPAVVQPVVIDVVANHTLRDIKNLVMHLNYLAVVFSYGIVLSLYAAQAPFVLIEPFVVIDVNYGELPLRQRYQLVLVTCHSSLVHRI